jgi:desulfoferrodoxin (superoxide reductase-like protein)
MNNAQDEPFDETNLAGLYNAGKFGSIVVTSSHRDPPFAKEARGRVYVNIGSLGIDHPNTLDRHYMALVSIYDGEGPVAQRIKVESLTM